MLSIVNEVDPLIFRYICFVCDTNTCFSNNWYQSNLQFRISITCFVSFGIKDNSFMMLEDYAINFLHGDWNYCLRETDIDVMMLFKFDLKYVKLNFKAIASMELSFDIKLYLLCSYDGCLFMKNRWKLLQKFFGIFEFHEFRTIENYFRSIEWNNDQSVWFDWYSIASRSIKCSFSIDQAMIEYQSSQLDCLVRIF